MTEQFGRFWKLKIKDREGAFDFDIEQDGFGNSLRCQFEINASRDLRFYSGVIKVFNLEPTKRKQLVFNQLREDFGKGPLAQLTAGYQENNGLIFNGAVHRGYTIREIQGGDYITILQVGIPFKYDKKITIDPQPINDNNLLGFLKKAIDKILNQPDRISINKAQNYETNFETAINDFLSTGNIANKTLGYHGTSIKIIGDIEEEFNIKFFQDHNGFNVVGGKFATSSDPRTPITLPQGNTVPEITFNKETGLIGSPIYTDTGAKFFVYLRPEIKMFQFVRVESDVLTKNVSIQSLIHRGDNRGDEWFSEIDASNFNQLIRNK